MPRPYQPSLLRLLHGPTALLVPLAWITGLLAYSAHDGRFGRLPLSGDIENRPTSLSPDRVVPAQGVLKLWRLNCSRGLRVVVVAGPPSGP